MSFKEKKHLIASTVAAFMATSSGAQALECNVDFFWAGQNDAGSWGMNDEPHGTGIIRQYSSGLVAYQFGDTWVTTASEVQMFEQLNGAVRGLAASAQLSEEQRSALAAGDAMLRGHVHVRDPDKRFLTDAIFPVGDDIIIVSAVPNPDDPNGYYFSVALPSDSLSDVSTHGTF